MMLLEPLTSLPLVVPESNRAASLHETAIRPMAAPLSWYPAPPILAAQLNTWSLEEMAVQLALALESKALQILSNLRQGSWEVIERVRQQRFGRCTYADNACEQLANQ